MNILSSLERLTVLDYGLLAALLIVFGVQLYYYLYHYSSILKYRKKQKPP